MKIVESTCAECGSKDSLFPVPDSSEPQRWECDDCGAVFVEES